MLYSVYPVSKAARARKMVFIVTESCSDEAVVVQYSIQCSTRPRDAGLG